MDSIGVVKPASALPLTEVTAQIIAAAQRGEPQAHAAIYACYSRRLFTLIYRLVPRRAQAEDLLQEVFVDVLRGIDGYQATGPFGGWLRSIAINKCLMHLRSPWSRTVEWLTSHEPEAITTPLDHTLNAQAELEAALAHLPPITRAVVWLHDVEGFTHGEIARRLKRTTSFSKSQLARAHVRLRELLTADTSTSSMNPTENAPCTPVTHSLSINS